MKWNKFKHGNKIKAVARMYNDGLSILQIARMHDVDRTTIRYHLKKLGLYEKKV